MPMLASTCQQEGQGGAARSLPPSLVFSPPGSAMFFLPGPEHTPCIKGSLSERGIWGTTSAGRPCVAWARGDFSFLNGVSCSRNAGETSYFLRGRWRRAQLCATCVLARLGVCPNLNKGQDPTCPLVPCVMALLDALSTCHRAWSGCWHTWTEARLLCGHQNFPEKASGAGSEGWSTCLGHGSPRLGSWHRTVQCSD